MLNDRGEGQIMVASSSGSKTQPVEKWSKVELKSRGLGDTIAKMTHALGIKQCGGCKKRQSKLNKIFPYKDIKVK
jgi:hypothetical protein